MTPSSRIPGAPLTHGTWRVGGTRVTLETIVAAFDRGDSAEEMHERYATVGLGDIYTVITYYLRNPYSVRVYLKGRAAVGSEVRSVVEDTIPRRGYGPACSPGPTVDDPLPSRRKLKRWILVSRSGGSAVFRRRRRCSSTARSRTGVLSRVRGARDR